MSALILQSTPIAQWHALVEEAERESAIHLNTDLESYLVFLLMRFSNQPELAAKIFAYEFLEAAQSTRGIQREKLLQTIGDGCLLYAGLFPEQASKRLVRLTYFVDIGRSAYSMLEGELFTQLSHGFVSMMDILQTMRDLSGEMGLSLSPIEAEELWSEIGSQRARKILERYTAHFLNSRH